MIKQLKNITVQILAGANFATIAVMLLIGYSDRLDPADHPMLSTVGMTFPIFLLINLGFLLFWLVFKWSRAWIPILGFALAYVPISIYMPLHPLQDETEGDIKLISYNVCTYGGNFKYENGFDTIFEYLKTQEPDIVCVQEDVSLKHPEAMKAYAEYFEYNDTVYIKNTAHSHNALGIHTRYPILRHERIDYPSDSKGSVAWWLQVGRDTLIVVNNHFESCHLSSADRYQYRQILHGEIKGDSVRQESELLLIKLAEANAKRKVQIDAVCRYVAEHSDYPIIVCGDFNDNPISYSRHTMSQLLTDCFVSAGMGVGLSYNQKAFSFRIDHAFCSDRLLPVACKIDSKMDASDHYPLLCWLKMLPKQGKMYENPQEISVSGEK